MRFTSLVQAGNNLVGIATRIDRWLREPLLQSPGLFSHISLTPRHVIRVFRACPGEESGV